MRYIFILIFSISLTSCEYEKYPPENYTIPQRFRDLISSFKVNDTLKFQNQKGNRIELLIKSIDSTLINKRGQFINARELKDISISCKELTCTKQGYDEYALILINKYADEDSATFDIRLMNFFNADKTLPINQRLDTVSTKSITFTNYYLFRPDDYKYLKDKNSISQIYMTKHDGIIAFKSLDGSWWTKAN